MTFKEFEEKVKEWGEKYNQKPEIDVDFIYINIEIRDGDFNRIICTIHKLERFVMDLNWDLYRDLSENERNDLFKIVTEFSATRIEDREDKKQGALNKMGRFLYIVYDWTDRDTKVVSYNRDKAYAKVGEDYLEGESIDDYHVLKIDLEDENLLQEIKEIE